MGFIPYHHNQSCKSKIITIYQSIVLFVYDFICDTVSDKTHKYVCMHIYMKIITIIR